MELVKKNDEEVLKDASKGMATDSSNDEATSLKVDAKVNGQFDDPTECPCEGDAASTKASPNKPKNVEGSNAIGSIEDDEKKNDSSTEELASKKEAIGSIENEEKKNDSSTQELVSSVRDREEDVMMGLLQKEINMATNETDSNDKSSSTTAHDNGSKANITKREGNNTKVSKPSKVIPGGGLRSNEVIDLMDDDDDVEIISGPRSHSYTHPQAQTQAQMNNVPSTLIRNPLLDGFNAYMSQSNIGPYSQAQSSFYPYVPLSASAASQSQYQYQFQAQSQPQHYSNAGGHSTVQQYDNYNNQSNNSITPMHIPLPPNFTPTWKDLTPPTFYLTNDSPTSNVATGGIQFDAYRGYSSTSGPLPMTIREYKLSLISVSEFTVTPLTPDSPISHLRSHIKQMSRSHGGSASFQDGRWRIPLSCYQTFYTWLSCLPQNRVEGIPSSQLQIASMGKALKERNCPSVETVTSYGVPLALAQNLAPYQRAGVDFVVSRSGRALIADEMGLGKTVQAIASMSVYQDEWPLLVLCPSGARYHWEAELYHWLGEEDNQEDKVDQSILYSSSDDDSYDPYSYYQNNISDSEGSYDYQPKRKRLKKLNQTASPPRKKGPTASHPFPPLRRGQIHVANSRKDTWSDQTRILVCAYSICVPLITDKRITPDSFKCAIADESHMLKNPKSQRTLAIAPMLEKTKRCILLSGTPALAKPMELYPQLKCLRVFLDNDQKWSEAEFLSQYCHNNNLDAHPSSLSELHTLLTSTVMIRRMKADILKSLPQKIRKKVYCEIQNQKLMQQISKLMEVLRYSKGVLGKLYLGLLEGGKMVAESVADKVILDVEKEVLRIDDNSDDDYSLIGNATAKKKRKPQDNDLDDIPDTLLLIDDEKAATEEAPKQIITKLFQLTSHSKLPVIITKLKKWIADPTKGKLCIFGHHVAILDAIMQGANLTIDTGKSRKKTPCIRIDGSTMPKERQRMVQSFQTNPKVRIAVLNITAAGVAVTLTAASTVWFAELFWTPALLVQAEDRCHRIGQQATVKVKYFIGKGTLDEVLWLLVEKKFRDLGEFVEGRATNIKIHQEGTVEMESSDSDNDDDDNPEPKQIDENENTDKNNSSNDKLDEKNTAAVPSKGVDMTNAICLSDNDEPKDSQKQASSLPTPSVQFMRFYRLTFHPPTYGLVLVPYDGRIVVCKESSLGRPYPEFGDILIAINNHKLKMGIELDEVLKMLQKTMSSSPPVNLMFGTDHDFRNYFWEHVMPRVNITGEGKPSQKKRRKKKKDKGTGKKTPVNEDVIELLDDE